MNNANEAMNPLPRYRPHKTVYALKVSRVEVMAGEENERLQNVILHFEDATFSPRKISTLNRPKPTIGWYMVEYEDGYISFSPANSFEDGYTRISGMTSGDAVSAMKRGELVARSGWNGKSMFLFLVPGSTFQVNRAPLNVIFPEGTEVNYCPHIDMKTADGKIVPWVASQTDILAEDWQVVSR